MKKYILMLVAVLGFGFFAFSNAFIVKADSYYENRVYYTDEYSIGDYKYVNFNFISSDYVAYSLRSYVNVLNDLQDVGMYDNQPISFNLGAVGEVVLVNNSTGVPVVMAVWQPSNVLTFDIRLRGGVYYYAMFTDWEDDYTEVPMNTPANAVKFVIRFPSDSYIITQSEAFKKGYELGYNNATNEIEFLLGQSYDDGLYNGRKQGYDQAKLDFYESRYNEGWQAALDSGLAGQGSSFNGLLKSIFSGMGALLAIELLPNITIGILVAFPLVFGLIFFIIGRKKD